MAYNPGHIFLQLYNALARNLMPNITNLVDGLPQELPKNCLGTREYFVPNVLSRIV